MGWSLGLGSINRDAFSGKVTIDLNGTSDELVLVSGGLHRTKRESFLKIQRVGSPEYWEAWDKSGTYYRFGATESSRHFHSTWDGVNYGTQVYRWDLDYARDTDGNEMTIEWSPVIGSDCSGSGVWGYCASYHMNAYPTSIRYSLNDAGGARRRIDFAVDERADDDNINTLVKECRKLTDIRMYVSDNLVRRYHFDYSDTEDRLLLAAVTQYGTDNTSALPAWTFTYTWLDFHFRDPYADPPESRDRTCTRYFLISAENGQSGKVAFSYQERGPGENWWNHITWTRQIAIEKRLYDGLNATPAVTSYAYEEFNSYVAPGEPYERGEFRGHDRVTVTHPDSHVEHHRFYQGLSTGSRVRVCEDGLPLGSGTYADTPADADDNLLEGKEYEHVVHAGADGTATLARTYRRWEVVAYHPRSPGDRQYLQGYDSNTPCARRRTDYFYDGYGNVYRKHDYGQSDAQYYRRTETVFLYNTTAYIVDKPQIMDVFEWKDGADVIVSRKCYSYDGQAYGAYPTIGHVSKEEYGLALPDYSIRKYGYDLAGVYQGFPYGNTIHSTDPKGYVTSTVYDPTYHTFPISITVQQGGPLPGFTTTTEYDYRLGKPTRIVDPNNAVTKHEYDIHGRIVKTWKPTEPEGSPDTATIVYRYDTSTVPNMVAIGVRKDAGGARGRAAATATSSTTASANRFRRRRTPTPPPGPSTCWT